MEVKPRFERPSKAGQAIIPGLPILPHGVERHVVPGGGSRGIRIDKGDEITVVDREGLQPAEMVFFAPNGLSDAGMIGAISIIFGVILSFIIGAMVALIFGYDDAVSITTIGAGAATYIVGPVTGSALSADSDVIALSVAVGLIKSILVMILTPFIAPYIKLNNAESAMIFGGLMGTTSGVAGGLAATDPELVPYGAMTATFYTGVGCLLAPSILFLIVNALIN